MVQFEGMRIRGTDFLFLDRGDYGAIFANRAQQRIRKVYLAHQEIKHSCEVFAAEIGAYKVANNTPGLRNLVPRYFGRCPGQVIVDATGQDVTTEWFHSALAFEAELIECEFLDLSDAPEQERGVITDLFRKQGICHVRDASVCLQDNKVVKVIDFALKWIEPQHHDLPDPLAALGD